MNTEILLVRCRNSLIKGPSETAVTGVYPPLGLAYIASALRKAGFKVKILDLQVSKMSLQDTEKLFRREKPLIVGITAITLGWPDVIKMARWTKKVLPKSLLVVGGPHLSMYPEESLSFDFIDVGICGEGEETMVELAQKYIYNRAIDNIKGIVVKKLKKIIINPPRGPVENVDKLSFPAFDLLQYRKYWALGIQRPFFTMITGRGCPYRCTFCYQDPLVRYRQRSAISVVEEFEIYIKKYGAKELIIFDDSFTVDRQRVLEICRLIRIRNLNFKWNIRTRADLIDEELLRNLKEAGCYSLHIGVESGEQKILDAMNKGITISQIKKAFKLANNLGFETRGYFMIGYLGEDSKTIRKTIDFSKELDLDWASFTVTIGHPKTELYESALKNGVLKDDYWKNYTLDKMNNQLPYFPTDEYDEKRLNQMKNWAYLSFYLSPRFLLSKFLSVRMLRQIRHLISISLRILFET